MKTTAINHDIDMGSEGFNWFGTNIPSYVDNFIPPLTASLNANGNSAKALFGSSLFSVGVTGYPNPPGCQPSHLD